MEPMEKRTRVLVATDGAPAALGALRLARALEEKGPTHVDVIGVAEPAPVFDAGFLVAVPDLATFQARKEALAGEIRSQLARLGRRPSTWPLRVETGTPAPVIVHRARETGAGLILLGLGKHHPLDRFFGTETALQVIRLSHIPVVAVPEEVSELPSSAVLGVDFSHFSQGAAQATTLLLDRPFEIHLTHVMSGMEFLPTVSQEWRTAYREEILDRLDTLSRGFPRTRGSSVHLHTLEGDPAHELLSFAEERGTDLLAVGSHGLSFVGRLLMGSVSTQVVRGTTVPALVVPPPDRASEVSPQSMGLSGGHTWARELREFSGANTGRRTTIEVSDLQGGIQTCGRDLPLLGVDYDHRMDRVEIMLGRTGTVEGHLTHSIPDPLEVEVERGEAGEARALRIRLEEGEIVLRIHR